jgi:hypothetical protein
MRSRNMQEQSRLGKLHQIHPKKVATIKVEVEKLLRVGFIYPVPLTEWVSNIVPIIKK